MKIEHRLEPKLTQELRVTPQMILINRILQLQRLELNQEVEQALKENPALELVEEKRCPNCGELIDDGISCRVCETRMEYKRPDMNEYRERSFDDLVSEWDSGHFEDSTTYDRTSQDDEFDSLANTAADVDFRKEIRRNFLITYSDLSEVEINAGKFLIELIDEKGLIDVNDADIAEELGVLVDVVISVREKIMQLDPVGIGAKNPTQAMMVQLDVLSRDIGREVLLEKKILNEYRDILAKEDYARIAKLEGIDVTRVREAAEFIREQLYAYPSEYFEATPQTENDPDFYPQPDVVIRAVDGEYYPEILDSGLPQFRISNFYVEAYQKIKQGRGKEFTEEEKKHIRQYFEKAQFFLMCINQRRETITRICNYLIKYQKDFLRNGIRKLKDLTREKVAQDIGFHPSTISRALKDKYVQLPDKSIHSFDIFFDYQKVLILVIKEIIERCEDLKNTLSDDLISEKMKELGFDVARRTVTKYRERGKIPSKSIRRRRFLERAGVNTIKKVRKEKIESPDDSG